MNTKSIESTSTLFTRRSALGLVLAGATLPVTKSVAGKIDYPVISWYVPLTTAVLAACSGESLTALFESTMSVDSTGTARGFMRFTLGREVVEYVAELGGLDLDPIGEPIRAWLLLRRLGSSAKVAQDFMFGSVTPAPDDPVNDCLIYTTVGSFVYVEPVRFEVPARWEVYPQPVEGAGWKRESLVSGHKLLYRRWTTINDDGKQLPSLRS